MSGKFENRHAIAVPVLLSLGWFRVLARFHGKDRPNGIGRAATKVYDGSIISFDSGG
jgi:hypothetical protein